MPINFYTPEPSPTLLGAIPLVPRIATCLAASVADDPSAAVDYALAAGTALLLVAWELDRAGIPARSARAYFGTCALFGFGPCAPLVVSTLSGFRSDIGPGGMWPGGTAKSREGAAKSRDGAAKSSNGAGCGDDSDSGGTCAPPPPQAPPLKPFPLGTSGRSDRSAPFASLAALALAIRFAFVVFGSSGGSAGCVVFSFSFFFLFLFSYASCWTTDCDLPQNHPQKSLEIPPSDQIIKLIIGSIIHTPIHGGVDHSTRSLFPFWEKRFAVGRSAAASAMQIEMMLFGWLLGVMAVGRALTRRVTVRVSSWYV
jgi:hypothetical protein